MQALFQLWNSYSYYENSYFLANSKEYVTGKVFLFEYFFQIFHLKGNISKSENLDYYDATEKNVGSQDIEIHC